jgi:DNA gyrase subunit A
VINIDATERNGDVVGMNLVTDADEVMLITERGILIRTGVMEIRETGRNAAGVRLIKLDEGDRLVAMAKVDKEEQEEKGDDKPETGSPNDPSRTSGPDGETNPKSE